MPYYTHIIIVNVKLGPTPSLYLFQFEDMTAFNQPQPMSSASLILAPYQALGLALPPPTVFTEQFPNQNILPGSAWFYY